MLKKGDCRLEEYQGIVVVGQENEPEARFSARLSEFWTAILRKHPEQFEGIYAEASEFGSQAKKPTRQYAVDPAVVAFLLEQLADAGIDLMPVDPDDTYSRYEAVAPDWWQIEH